VERNTSTTIAQQKQWPRRSYNNGSRYSHCTLTLLQTDNMSRYAQQVEGDLIPLLSKWGREGPTFEQIDHLINE